MPSWWNRPQSKFLTRPVRRRAAAYADKKYRDRESAQWNIAFQAFTCGWIAANRQKFAELRVKVQAQ